MARYAQAVPAHNFQSVSTSRLRIMRESSPSNYGLAGAHGNRQHYVTFRVYT